MKTQVIKNLKAKIRELESRCNVVRKHLQDNPKDELKKSFYHYDIEFLRLQRLNQLWQNIEHGS